MSWAKINAHLLLRLTLPCFTLASQASAGVLSLYPAGTNNQRAGIESSIAARGGDAVLYNPANLALDQPRGVKAEIGYLKFSYSYEHPDFDPVHVRIATPTGIAGYNVALTDSTAVGVLIFPAMAGKLKIPGLPRRMADEDHVMTIKSELQTVHTGIGIGQNISPAVKLGISFVHSWEKRHLHARLVDNINPLGEVDANNQFSRLIFGSRLEYTPFSFALSYMPAVTKTYRGRQRLTTDEADTKPRLVEYDPSVLNLGLAGRYGNFATALILNQQFWRAGRPLVKDGLNADPLHADLKDVLERGLQLSYQATPAWLLAMSYAELPTPWGPGVYDAKTVANEGYVMGVGFGHFNGMDRKVFALGATYAGNGYEMDTTLYRTTGSREVPIGGENKGYYQMEILTFSTGFTVAL